MGRRSFVPRSSLATNTFFVREARRGWTPPSSMAPPEDVMVYVTDAMKSDSTIQDKLLCVSRLRVIALALGEEKTRTQLLPFLKSLCEKPVRSAARRAAAP